MITELLCRTSSLFITLGRFAKKQSLDCLESKYRIDFAHIIFAPANVFRRHAFEKVRIPIRHPPRLCVCQDLLHVRRQLSSKPTPIRQIFMQSENSHFAEPADEGIQRCKQVRQSLAVDVVELECCLAKEASRGISNTSRVPPISSIGRNFAKKRIVILHEAQGDKRRSS